MRAGGPGAKREPSAEAQGMIGAFASAVGAAPNRTQRDCSWLISQIDCAVDHRRECRPSGAVKTLCFWPVFRIFSDLRTQTSQASQVLKSDMGM
jgi:hypothetical protein